MHAQKHIIIISGPSGSGQDTVIRALEKRFAIERVITTTSRSMRPTERQGDPYYFTDPDTFHARIEKGDFFEWAKQYNGQYYGVTKEEIDRVANSGKLGIWKLDYQGVEHAKELFPGIQAVLLTAPLHELEARIRRRDNPTDAYVAERMAYTKESLAHAGDYDLVVDNRDGALDETVETISEFIESHLEVHGLI